MALKILDYSLIKSLAIVDDDPSVRASYEDMVEDLELEPIAEPGPFQSIEQIVKELPEKSQAAICDHHLTKNSYANFNGAEVVARWYENSFPAVLCTSWVTAKIEEFRKYRRYLPALLRSEEVEPENIAKGLEICIEEFKGKFREFRKPWRAQVRIEDIDPEEAGVNRLFFVTVVGWSTNEVVGIKYDDVSPDLQHRLDKQDIFHAQVNLGTEKNEELYFEKWEFE